MALDTAHVTAIQRGLTRKFLGIVGKATNEAFYPTIATVTPSRGSDEQYPFLGAMPGVREWLGDRVAKQLRGGDFTIKNRLWESTLELPRHYIDDDRLSLLTPLISDLAIEAANHPDELVFEALLAGGTDLCWDGLPFFSASHVWGDSGTQSNVYAANPAAGAAGAITAADCKNFVGAARNQLLRLKNDQGKYFNRTTMTNMRNVMILMPPELEQQMTDALLTRNYQLTSGVGGDNRLAGMVVPQLHSSPLLTDARVFYLLNLGRSIKPFIFQRRTNIKTEVVGLNSIKEKDAEFMTEVRYNVGYGAWMSIIRVTFS
jgi:phage major head subunit gpT-like protein